MVFPFYTALRGDCHSVLKLENCPLEYGSETRSGPKIPAVGLFGRGDILNSGKKLAEGY